MKAPKNFFNAVRKSLFSDRLSQKQVDGLNIITSYCEDNKVPLVHAAYILATAYHETAYTMEPLEEYGKGRGRSYGKPDPVTGQTYYGRGFVQLTWKENYRRAGEKLSENFVDFPEDVMEPEHAVAILVKGMQEGWFTGKALHNYDTLGGNFDAINARRIVNGTDRAQQIAGYCEKFVAALEAGGYGHNFSEEEQHKVVPQADVLELIDGYVVMSAAIAQFMQKHGSKEAAETAAAMYEQAKSFFQE